MKFINLQNTLSTSLALLALLFSNLICAAKGLAQWDTSTLHTLGSECGLLRSEVDESKLTIHFTDMLLDLPLDTRPGQSLSRNCSVALKFKVPAHHRVKTFTHRSLAFARKSSAAEVQLQFRGQAGGVAFAHSGTLPFGSPFEGKVLLYKAFLIGESIECQQQEQSIDVFGEWEIIAENRVSNATAMLSLSGENLWTDLWIETVACPSADTTTLRDRAVR
ncbi:hypothetical protein EBU99_02520 [bacterium]|nr:hypothetical protein [bacterium]